MKDKIVFFVLGAVLATVAYFVGDMDNLSADSEIGSMEFDTVVVENLYVKDKLTVSEYVGAADLLREFPCIVISADRKAASIAITSALNVNSKNHGTVYVITESDGDPGIFMRNSKGESRLLKPY